MKKHFTLPSACICLILILFSCTETTGVKVTKTFPVNSSYYYLYLDGGMRAKISDQVDQVVITADEGVMEKIKVENTSGTLRIFRKDIALAYYTNAEVLIPYNPRLRQIEMSFDSELSTDYGIEGDEVKLRVEQRSKFWGYILAESLDMKVTDHSAVFATYDVQNDMYLRVKDKSLVDLDGYADVIHLEMDENSETEPRWQQSNYYAFSCNTCYGTMSDNCKAFIDCEERIAMTLTKGSVLYYTSDPDIDDCLLDNSSDIVYNGGH